VNLFVAGGTGILGRRIVPQLLAQGHTVTVLTRDPSRARQLAELGAIIVRGDAFEAAHIGTLLVEAHPDIVIHQLTDLAAGSSADNARLRIDGTRNLVDGAMTAGARRIVVQSIAWCYEPGTGPATESTPLDVGSDDPARRATVNAVCAMEAAAAEMPEWVVLRNGTLYGPDTWYAADGRIADAAHHSQLAADLSVTSFVHVDDAAAAAVQALRWPTGTINIVDDEPACGHDWVPAFCSAVAAPPPSLTYERHNWARGANNETARQLGWTPEHPNWRDGFAVSVGQAGVRNQ
jgi:nucleoside-diphosphate-sugar epimerase